MYKVELRGVLTKKCTVYIMCMYRGCTVIRTQVYLTNQEKQKLSLLSRQLGQHQSSLIREAIDLFIETKTVENKQKINALEQAQGLWAERQDLPDFDTLRREFDRC